MRSPGGLTAAAQAGAAVACAALALAGCKRVERPPAHPVYPAAAPGPCLLLTAPHGKDAFVVRPGAEVTAPRCEIHVDSDEMFFAAVLNAGSRLDTGALCVAGDIERHGGLVSEPRRLCSANIDRFRRPPPPEAAAPCGPPPPDGPEATLQPGVYCGGVDLRGRRQVTFAPGLYVVRGGDLRFGAGTYSGRDVSFFFADVSKPMLVQGAEVTLSAPADGPRAGVLMDEAPGLPASDLPVGAADFALDGLVHLPSRRATFGDGSRLRSARLLMVFDTARLDATRWTISEPWRP